MRESRRASSTFSSRVSSSDSRIQLTSAPPQKVLPFPERTMARTLASAPSVSKAARSASISSAR
jgi:hypothetical protein